jgi:(R,R)-butanediol dehydrogenase/meso-butanediol dehydrogenase/diacetyl reductase
MFTGICKDINGGFAEVVVAHQSQVYHVPPEVSPEAATLTEPLAVALQALLDNRPQSGEKVLIIGGGVIGSLLVKTVRALDIDCHITVVEPSPFQATYVKKAGADHVIRSGLMDETVTITAGRAYKPMLGDKILMGGFDRVYDTVGHSPTLNSALRLTTTGGTISVIGIGKEVKLDLTPLWLKLQTVKGSYAYGYNETGDGPRQAFQMALDMMGEGRIEVEDMLTHKFSLKNYLKMIEVNINKSISKAMKTAVSFEAL